MLTQIKHGMCKLVSTVAGFAQLLHDSHSRGFPDQFRKSGAGEMREREQNYPFCAKLRENTLSQAPSDMQLHRAPSAPCTSLT